MEVTAEASLAEIFARSRVGIAIAAMIRIIATTISNSINENPLCLRIGFPVLKYLSFGEGTELRGVLSESAE